MTSPKTTEKRLFILDTALKLVRQLGFEAVSLSDLAKEVGMSKSGLFSHFQSKQSMHLMILDHAAESFTHDVIIPALKMPRGLSRLEAILENWLKWYQADEKGSCPFLAAGVRYDGKQGPVQERVRWHLGQLVKAISRAVLICIEEGELRPDSDADQLAYEIYSLVLGSQIYSRTLGRHVANKRLYRSYGLILGHYKV